MVNSFELGSLARHSLNRLPKLTAELALSASLLVGGAFITSPVSAQSLSPRPYTYVDCMDDMIHHKRPLSYNKPALASQPLHEGQLLNDVLLPPFNLATNPWIESVARNYSTDPIIQESN